MCVCVEKGVWPGSCDPVNSWALNANISKMTKDTNFKFGKHAPRENGDVLREKNFEQGAWLGHMIP